MTPERIKAARDILAFYVENGADAALGEAPVDRFADPAPEPQRQAAPRPAPMREPERSRPELPRDAVPLVAARPSPDEAEMAARTAAKTAASLEELRAILDRFEGCNLRTTAKQLVFADGNPQARIMFVGEAPGKEEDFEGLPFVGPSGQLLNLMLAAIGLDRTSAYITNIIPWRPPGNRDPSTQETQICLPFIRRHIELVDPDILVCLGKPSTIALLGVNDGIRRLRGKWMNYDTGTRQIRAMPMFHPAYLLRTPLEKRFAWRDLLAIRKALNS